jgi:hypothetical protein
MIIGLLSDRGGFAIGTGLTLNGFVMSSVAAILLLRARAVFARDGAALGAEPVSRAPY